MLVGALQRSFPGAANKIFENRIQTAKRAVGRTVDGDMVLKGFG
jgi:hypothetical protein